jgi:hypothetical protein
MKILFVIHLKHFSFWPLAGVKPMQNDLAHAMPWQCKSALSMVYYDLYDAISLRNNQSLLVRCHCSTKTVSLYWLTAGQNVIKLFTAVIYKS